MLFLVCGGLAPGAVDMDPVTGLSLAVPSCGDIVISPRTQWPSKSLNAKFRLVQV